MTFRRQNTLCSKAISAKMSKLLVFQPKSPQQATCKNNNRTWIVTEQPIRMSNSMKMEIFFIDIGWKARERKKCVVLFQKRSRKLIMKMVKICAVWEAAKKRFCFQQSGNKWRCGVESFDFDIFCADFCLAFGKIEHARWHFVMNLLALKKKFFQPKVKAFCIYTHWVGTAWKHPPCWSNRRTPATRSDVLLHSNCDLASQIWRLTALHPCLVRKLRLELNTNLTVD